MGNAGARLECVDGECAPFWPTAAISRSECTGRTTIGGTTRCLSVDCRRGLSRRRRRACTFPGRFMPRRKRAKSTALITSLLLLSSIPWNGPRLMGLARIWCRRDGSAVATSPRPIRACPERCHDVERGLHGAGLFRYRWACLCQAGCWRRSGFSDTRLGRRGRSLAPCACALSGGYAETSQEHSVSSSNRRSYRRGLSFNVGLAGLEAVVQAAEEAVEQVALGGCPTFVWGGLMA
jgi:hypothetical protein